MAIVGSTACLYGICYAIATYMVRKIVKDRKPIVVELTEEQQRKAKEMAQGWQNILNYDIRVARGDK